MAPEIDVSGKVEEITRWILATKNRRVLEISGDSEVFRVNKEKIVISYTDPERTLMSCTEEHAKALRAAGIIPEAEVAKS